MEFVYNNALSATTGISLFFANKGYHLNITIHPECDIASFRACDFAIDLDELQSTLKAEISAAQQRYQKSADVRCSSTPDFKVGDKVFVKAQFFRTTRPSKKLSKKYLGPYKIISQPGTLSFTLCLPESMHSVHPVFQSLYTLFTQSSKVYALCSPSLLCVHARTRHIQHFPQENATGFRSSHN